MRFFDTGKAELRIRTLLLAGAVFFAASIASAQQVLLTDDAAINSAATSTNYGGSTSIAINSANSVLLQFDLADILPTGITASQVTKARLILFPDKVTTEGDFNVYAVTSAWSETSVTYATQPTVSAAVAGTGTAKLGFRPAFVQVTGLIQNWVSNPSSNHGFEVKATGSTSFTIDSKENTATSHPAVLQIDLAGPAGATGATGPAGPKGATGATGPQGPTGGGLASVSHNDSFTGSGTSASPLALSPNVTIPGTLNTSDTITINTASGDGISATSSNVVGNGLYASGSGQVGYGVYAAGYYGIFAIGSAKAGVFSGDVYVSGTLAKAGGSFKIDHPLDPENKYLSHSFVESPDMKNVYDGVVVTDGTGTALVNLPDWFEALNRDFRYQLTTIGQPAKAWIGAEITGNHFLIKTDAGGVKVSWQVTGIRQDAWANAHRIPVEEEKPDDKKGRYLHPELFGHKGELNILERNQPLPPNLVKRIGAPVE